MVCFRLPTNAQPTVEPSPSLDDRIHPGDLIEIDELGGFDYDWRGRMDPEGYLAGFTKVSEPIQALCKTPSQLSGIVSAAYSTTLRNPRVVVRILDRSQRPLAIFDGAVRQPMRVQIRREVRLSELVILSGGFTDRASGEITIVRPAKLSCTSSNDSTTLISIQVRDILAGKDAANLSVLSGDIVTVRPVESLFVLGGVARPGRIDWRPGSTVSKAVAAAGGVSDRGVTGEVVIYRRTAEGSKIIEVDLDKVVSATSSDIEILPLDIIDVPLKGNPKRSAPPVVEELQTTPSSLRLPVRVVQ